MIKDARKERDIEVIDISAQPNKPSRYEGITVNVNIDPKEFRREVLENNSPRAAVRKLAPDLEKLPGTKPQPCYCNGEPVVVRQ